MSAKKQMLAFVSILLVGSFLLPATGLAQEETWQRAYQAYSGGNFSEAERLFQEVVEEYPEWGWAHLMLGITMQQRGKSAEALDHLQLAKDTVAEDQERFMVHNAIANVQLLQENYDAAINEANEAAQYAQNDDNRATVAKTKGQAYYWKVHADDHTHDRTLNALSPAYSALRDGGTSTIPAQEAPADG